MRLVWIIFALCLLASCNNPNDTTLDSATTELFALDSTTLDASNAVESKAVILLFYSNSCQPCKTLQKNLAHKSLENLASSYAIYPIDLYTKLPITQPFSKPISIKSLREILHIYATPTLVVFDTKHSIVFRHIGVLSVDELARLFTLLPTLPDTLQTPESKQQWIASHLTHPYQ